MAEQFKINQIGAGKILQQREMRVFILCTPKALFYFDIFYPAVMEILY